MAMRTLRRAAALTALFLPCTLADAQVRVQILHASDLEGGVGAIDAAPNFAAVVEALEAEAAQQGLRSLLLSAGDNSIPGPFFSAAADPSLRPVLQQVLGNPNAREGVGRVDVAIMNLLGFDASAVGNHEFDSGPGVYASMIGTDIVGTQARWLGTDFPYLSANLSYQNEPALAGLYTPQILPSTAFVSPLADLDAAKAAPKLARATIVEKDGERFGIVGATTPIVGTISSIGGTQVLDPGAGTNDMTLLAQIIQPVIDELTAEGVDKILLVTHLQQIQLEQQLVPLLRDVDVVIAGGSDTLLANPGTLLNPGDTAQGPYPIVTSTLTGDPAVIVSTDGQYSYVGRLVLEFDANGIVSLPSIDANESGPYATSDAGVLALFGDLTTPFLPGTTADLVRTLTDAVLQVVIQKDSVVLGRTGVFLEGRREKVRTEETNLGNLSADANLFLAQRLADPFTRVSLKNGGGIRAEIGTIDGLTGELLPPQANPLSGKQTGEVSQLDIENALRFNNGLTLLTLTREQLKAALEHAVAATAPGATPGQFGQVGGVIFSFDPDRPAGDRVRTAGFSTPGPGFPIFVLEGQVIAGPPVRTVTLNFLANGGDAYPFAGFVSADPLFADRVDLLDLGLPQGPVTFAATGSEQHALGLFLRTFHGVTPYAQAETPVTLDRRIQNLSERPDTVVNEVRRALFGAGL